MTDPEGVNQSARALYYKEVTGLVELLNNEIPEENAKLYVPDIKFRRGIGEYKGQRFSVKGELLDEQRYTSHLEQVLLTEKDRDVLHRIMKEKNWVTAG